MPWARAARGRALAHRTTSHALIGRRLQRQAAANPDFDKVKAAGAKAEQSAGAAPS